MNYLFESYFSIIVCYRLECVCVSENDDELTDDDQSLASDNVT